MEVHVFKISNPNQSVVFKPYLVKYEGQTKTKLWLDGVYQTYSEAEKVAKKLLVKLMKDESLLQRVRMDESPV